MSTSEQAPRTCIIGAGCSGFTMAKRLKDAGLAYDCFEMSDDIGGNWYFGNPNGMSSCYQSLHIDTSKWRLAFEDYPVPADWPDFPHHSQILQYFHDYVDHFGLRETITFNTAVTDCERLDDRRWKVTLSTGESREYDHLVVGNGHHWDARTPTYPGTFDGYQVHSHHYRDPFEPYDFRGKRVMIVGAGNSAMDISSELSQRPIAEQLFISMRHGVWVLPKYFDGKPADKASLPPWMPAKVGRALARKKIRKTIGNMEDYGLPKPDHRPLDAHPSVSGEFLTRVGCGDITPKGAIDSARRRRCGVHRRLARAGRRHRVGDRLQRDVPVLPPARVDPEGQHVPAVQADGEAGLREPVLPRSRPATADVGELRRAAVEARRRSDLGDLRVPAVQVR